MRDENPIRRLPAVDVLRGVSILLVVLLHIRLRFLFGGARLRLLMPDWVFRLLFTTGDDGVTIFFAVSGFLITLTSLRRFGSLARMRAATFYRIRFARIGPPLLIILAVLSVLHLLHVPGFRLSEKMTTLPRALLAALTFHLNWLEGKVGYLAANWDVLWSLSVEEMFYLFFPPVVLLALRVRRWGMWLLVAVLLGFVAAGPFARTVWTQSNLIWQEKSYLGGMDGIALGCLTALLTDRLSRQAERWRGSRALLVLAFAGAAAIVLVFMSPRWLNGVDRVGLDGTLLALGACMVMLATVLRGRPGRVWSEPLRWFGRHSYEVYLTHEFMVVWGTELYLKGRTAPAAGVAPGRAALVWVAGILLATAPLGWAFSRWVSEPLNRRLRPSRA